MAFSLINLASDIGPNGTAVIAILVPYLPALAREGQDVYDGFIKHLIDGKTDMIQHDNQGLYEGLPNPFEATRYHSLVIQPDTLSDEFAISAWSTAPDGQLEIMGIRHKTLPLFGVNLSGFTMGTLGYRLDWRISDFWSGGEYGPEAGFLSVVAVPLLGFALWKAPVKTQRPFLLREGDEA